METKDKLQRLCKEMDIKRKDIIKATHANKSTVSTWFNGVSKPGGKFLPGLCSLLKCDAGWLMDDSQGWIDHKVRDLNLLPDPMNLEVRDSSNAEYYASVEAWDDGSELLQDEISLPFFTEVEASAGTGNFQVQENHGPKLRFSRSTLKRHNIIPENAACIKVKGNSMEPILPDGSTIGVDTGSKNIIDGKMYAIDHDGMLRVKMLYRLPSGGLRLRSFNYEEHPEENYTQEQTKSIRIIGRVFWSSVMH